VLAPQGVFRLGPEPCNSNSNSICCYHLAEHEWLSSPCLLLSSLVCTYLLRIDRNADGNITPGCVL